MRVISIYATITDQDGEVVSTLMANSSNPMDLARFVHEMVDIDYAEDIGFGRVANDIHECWSECTPDTLSDRTFTYHDDPVLYQVSVQLRVHVDYL